MLKIVIFIQKIMLNNRRNKQNILSNYTENS